MTLLLQGTFRTFRGGGRGQGAQAADMPSQFLFIFSMLSIPSPLPNARAVYEGPLSSAGQPMERINGRTMDLC